MHGKPTQSDPPLDDALNQPLCALEGEGAVVELVLELGALVVDAVDNKSIIELK